MIIKKGNICDSKNNLLIKIVGVDEAGEEFSDIPHIKKEYNKYVHYCQKNNINPIGTVQYIPAEVWAMVMVDTMKNNNIIDYDKNYQYAVLLYGKNDSSELDIDAVKKALIDIRNKAEQMKASVSIVLDNKVYNIINDVFNNFDIEIWK